MSSSNQTPPGPPYPPTNAALGGLPTVDVDVPLSAVFMALFIGGAVGHMTLFQLNKRKGHKFILSGMMFGFCMARIVTMIMRIVWACYPTNIRVAIAAQIFVAAGVLLLFVVNLLFAQRVVRAAHPKLGWHVAFSTAFKILYALIPIILIMVITVTVQSFYTLDPHTKLVDHDVQLGAQTFLLFVSFLPIPLALFSIAVPRSNGRSLEKFGTGSWRAKIAILLVGSTLLCFGAGWRVGTNFMPPQPIDQPPWYFAKAAFWIVNFTIEAIVIYLYLIARVDQRFFVPNASRAAGGYAAAYTSRRDQQPSVASSDERSIDEHREDSEAQGEESFDAEKQGRGGASDEDSGKPDDVEKA